jgi:hypothetical protein
MKTFENCTFLIFICCRIETKVVFKRRENIYLNKGCYFFMPMARKVLGAKGLKEDGSRNIYKWEVG